MLDLDVALDDIIKKKKAQSKKPPQRDTRKQSKAPSLNRKTTIQQRSKAAVTKPSVRPNKVNLPSQSRPNRKDGKPSSHPVFKPYPASRSQRPATTQAPKSNPNIDPASIVITKNVSRRRGNFINQPVAPLAPLPSTMHEPVYHSQNPPVVRDRGISIRGAAFGSSSYGNGMYYRNVGGMSIRGQSGPATVLLSNLDPTANAEDIRLICSQFGHVTQCEVLVDKTGRSFGEAEVEFAQRSSALECIARLDNEVADGRILRAVLRQRLGSTFTTSSYVQAPRSLISPTRSGFTHT